MGDIQRLSSDNKSLYNSTADTLNRFNDLQKFIILYRCGNDFQSYSSWLNLLKSFDCEISPYCNDKEKKRIENVRINNLQYINLRQWQRSKNFYYNKLDNYERVLKEIFVSKGMGIINKELDNIHMIG